MTLYDKNLNYKWAVAYNLNIPQTTPTGSFNKCYFSLSTNYLVSSLFRDWNVGHDVVMINKISDGSVVKALIGSTNGGSSVVTNNYFVTATLNLNDTALAMAFS